MSEGDPHWSQPKRARVSVRDNGRHVGHATTVEYPNRDMTAFPEGSPYSEVVVSDLTGGHVALLQRFKQHWLVHCADCYATVEAGGVLTAAQVQSLARFALAHADDGNDLLAKALKREVEKMLGAAKPV